ncbi:MAG: PEP-CTERM sorting domain-containing protein [Crocosphaera sp.]|nr:PEP-CTERM sorting domain-containing protein [Crocosphaera sp.]
MSLFTSLKTVSFSVTTLVTLGIVRPAHAALLPFNLTDWEAFGDIVLDSDRALMTNANSNGLDDPVNFNLSGNDPVFAFDLELELGLDDGSLGFDSGDTSGGIKRTFSVQEGDVLSFYWNFLTNHHTPDSQRNDYAFVSVNDEIIRLADTFNDFTVPGLYGFAQHTGQQQFSYVFTAAGDYTIGLGVIDVLDDVTTSALFVQAVPEPLTILGTGVAIVFGSFFKRCLKKHKDG